MESCPPCKFTAPSEQAACTRCLAGRNLMPEPEAKLTPAENALIALARVAFKDRTNPEITRAINEGDLYFLAIKFTEWLHETARQFSFVDRGEVESAILTGDPGVLSACFLAEHNGLSEDDGRRQLIGWVCKEVFGVITVDQQEGE